MSYLSKSFPSISLADSISTRLGGFSPSVKNKNLLLLSISIRIFDSIKLVFVKFKTLLWPALVSIKTNEDALLSESYSQT